MMKDPPTLNPSDWLIKRLRRNHFNEFQSIFKQMMNNRTNELAEKKHSKKWRGQPIWTGLKVRENAIQNPGEQDQVRERGA